MKPNLMADIKYINRKTGEIVTEKPPSEALLKFLYYNPFGKLALNLFVKRKLLTEFYGRLMNSSKSTKRIHKFVRDLGIDMTEAVRPINEFTSFNDFFYRKLKPQARPIGKGLVSAADAKLLAFESISDVKEFFVKGKEFTLASYLQNEQLAEEYKNAALLIFRLAPNDYHRFHFPYSGEASEITKIKGKFFSVSPHALKPNFARVLCGNKREYMTLSTKDKGTILLSPVGATMVGTIIETYTPNTSISKGDEMGYFAFGGSTVVMLVDNQHFSIDADILENTKNRIETAVVMGEQIGS
ncbi:MAG: phosphatidylserine decarboxylase [Bacteroidia bacterium]|jgi:phosphatidylserine decarboxylase